MIRKFIRKIFGSRNDRLLKQYMTIVATINQLEQEIIALSDQELQAKTVEFRRRYQDGESLDDLLPEAFAVVREAAKRTLGMRHFDVQLVGGMALHYGKIAEMRTGEGKTLAATLAAYLNSLTNEGVHIITVNDYLAARDAEWMGPIYSALGLTIGVVVAEMLREDKQQAYSADIIYGTNNEFCFDYLRDNMAFELKDCVQTGLNYAIVDEVDSILVDEARTPLIISGADQDSSVMYETINKLVPKLNVEVDFTIDEKARQAHLTEEGHQRVEKLLAKNKLLKPDSSLYDAQNIGLMHHVNAGLRAHTLFKKDVDYIISNNEVVIIDEHTGRTMVGRRWSDGLHQAIEAKEQVPIQSENQTLASITFQNYFRSYNKLSGMTGTADTEAYEFQQIYNLEVVVIPTNKVNNRRDEADMIYLEQSDKFEAIIKDIEDCVSRNQPVLVGTISIETSEFLSKLLTKRKIKHQVLNAKFHAKEAEIIAEAGRPGAVTIATNMAGRGTDIVLGGQKTEDNQAEWQQRHEQVLAAGGLRVIGTERHESRRIDNQLRGRSGRQGDPGSTIFYLSIRDHLMRIFISDTLSAFLGKLGMEKGEAITHNMVTRAVENAQRKIEGHNFDIRKQLLEFDDVANEQRKVMYKQRRELMSASDVADNIRELQEDVLASIVHKYMPPESLEEQWQVAELEKYLELEFGQKLAIASWLEQDNKLTEEQILTKVINQFIELHKAKEQKVSAENLRYLEKVVLLNVLDHHWKEHLATMDYMRQSIHLRGYAQKDPKQEYKKEAFELFTDMLESIKKETVTTLALMQVKAEMDIEGVDASMRHEPQKLQYSHGESSQGQGSDKLGYDNKKKVGRNEKCPCGSGRKYKQCHGSLTKV